MQDGPRRRLDLHGPQGSVRIYTRLPRRSARSLLEYALVVSRTTARLPSHHVTTAATRDRIAHAAVAAAVVLVLLRVMNGGQPRVHQADDVPQAQHAAVLPRRALRAAVRRRGAVPHLGARAHVPSDEALTSSWHAMVRSRRSHRHRRWLSQRYSRGHRQLWKRRHRSRKSSSEQARTGLRDDASENLR